MSRREALLERLEAIGASLEASGHALALIGLGSVGRELARLDEFSDLDFFAIVEPGYKAAYINDLGWLERIHPVAYAVPTTPDGCKLLFADGIFCEYAVFEEAELAGIPFAAGRLVWSRPGVPAEIVEPVRPLPAPAEHPVEWLVGEALTNLYVGLCRYQRGEKLSAQRFVQGYAVDRVLELVVQTERAAPGEADPFNAERRFEQRYPETARLLSGFIPGYEGTPQAAEAILQFLESHFEVNPELKRAILVKIRTIRRVV
jgi:hypothetical protein